ncbi:MAG: hypothetical protein J6Q31_02135, partial [Alistipes sp.]|nr:hypothetical protein [Alistipes sp.]
MEQNDLLTTQQSEILECENGADNSHADSCGVVLSPSEQTALDELEREYQLQRAEEQKIIQAELDR